LEWDRRQVGPEVGPTAAVYSCVPTGTHGDSLHLLGQPKHRFSLLDEGGTVALHFHLLPLTRIPQLKRSGVRRYGSAGPRTAIQSFSGPSAGNQSGTHRGSG
jgi:hypothetical protein